MQKKYQLILMPLLLFSGACANNGFFPQDTPTDKPAPLSSPTIQESATPDLSATASQAALSAVTLLSPSGTSVLASPSPGITITPPATPVPLIPPEMELPDGEIQIYVPGELSRVTSPFRFVANLTPSPNHTYQIELLGEDGRTLTLKIEGAFLPPGIERTNVVSEIAFEIDEFAEAARLVVSVNDEYGRLHALASVNLVLISTGITEMKPYTDRFENIIIQQPSANVMLRGDSLIVTGLARTNSDNLLAIEMIDREGKVIAFGFTPAVVPEGEYYGFFAAELSYQVDEPTWVLIVVRENGDRISGPVHISSIEMVISP